MERRAGAIDETGDPVGLGLGRVMGEAVKLLGPERMFLCPVKIKEAGIEDQRRVHPRVIRLDQTRIGVQRPDDPPRRIRPFRPRVGDLVQQDDIREFDLVGQQVHKAAGITLACHLAPVGQKVVAGEIAQQVDGIDHRHHAIQPRHIRQAVAILIPEVEGRGHGQGFGYPGRFDQQMVEPPLGRQRPHMGQEIAAQRAADAAVGHLDQLFLGLPQVGAFADQVGVDVHLGHVVDDHRHAAAVAVVQDVVHQGGLAGPQKAGQDSDGQAGVGHRAPRYVIV